MDNIELLCNQKEIMINNSSLNITEKQHDLEKVQMIRDIIKEENWTFKVSTNELLNILYFLGIPKEKLKEAHSQLVSIENYVNHETLKIIN